ncbi:hypothetical protein AM274_07325 [Pseudomonas nunensis]|nr:hypothetical protein AM274_07325 [Pseudomonas nunensis]
MWERADMEKVFSVARGVAVARGLAPVGLRSSPIISEKPKGRFATQRGQAPSPQKPAPKGDSGLTGNQALSEGIGCPES